MPAVLSLTGIIKMYEKGQLMTEDPCTPFPPRVYATVRTPLPMGVFVFRYVECIATRAESWHFFSKLITKCCIYGAVTVGVHTNKNLTYSHHYN